jgi:hypothetical protein
MQGVTNYESGRQRFHVEVQLSDEEAASRVSNALGESSELYLARPHLVEREDTEDGRVRLRIRADVLPSMAWMIEENLTGRIKAAAGEEALMAEPLVYKVDQASLRRIRELLPQEAEKSLPEGVERRPGSPYQITPPALLWGASRRAGARWSGPSRGPGARARASAPPR